MGPVIYFVVSVVTGAIVLISVLYLFFEILFPYAASVILSTLFRKSISKLRFRVDLFRFQIREIVFANRKYELKINQLRFCPNWSDRLLRLDLYQVTIIFNEGKGAEGHRVNVRTEDSRYGSIALLKGCSRYLEITCDSLRVVTPEDHVILVAEKSFLSSVVDNEVSSDLAITSIRFRYHTDSFRYSWDNNHWIDIEASVIVTFNAFSRLIESIDVTLLRTRAHIHSQIFRVKTRSPHQCDGNENSFNETVKRYCTPSVLLNVKAELMSVDLTDLNIRASVGLCQVRRENYSSISVTCLNFASSHESHSLIRLDAINFHSSAEQSHVASITKCFIDGPQHIIKLMSSLTRSRSSSSPSTQKDSSVLGDKVKVDVIISDITVDWESRLKLTMPSLTWKVEKQIGHCVNFDVFSVSKDSTEFFVVSDVILLLKNEKLSVSVGSSTLTVCKDLLSFLNSNNNKEDSEERLETTESSGKVSVPRLHDVSFKVTNFKTRFIVLERHNVNFVLKVSNLAYQSVDSERLAVDLFSLQIFLMKASKTERILLMENLNLVKIDSDVRLNVNNEVFLLWRPDIHLAAHNFYRILVQRPRKKKKSETNLLTIKFVVNFVKVRIDAVMQKTVLTLHYETPSLEIKDKLYKFVLPSILFDANPGSERFVSMSGLVVKFYARPTILCQYRSEIEGVQDEANRTLEVFLTLFQLNLFHELNFHQIFFTEFMGIYKWLKRLHSLGRSENVSPDLIFYIKQFQVDFHDDPFEIRLKENYELIEDEHFESEKRKKVLESKIEDFQSKSQRILPENKVKELFTQLRKKNADIFVKRAQNYHAKATKKSKLLTWNISSLQFMILADTSMNGTKTVQEFIRRVDQESPWPENLELVTQILRWIRFECKLSTIYLRDFPQPLADFRHVLLWGKIALADEAPVERALRNWILSIEEPFEDVVIQRSLVATKMYHDLAMDMETFSAAHGPCWEPVLSHFSLLLNNVFGTSSDPSPPLPWWDKIRFLLHGRILISCKSFKLMLHVSPDPYNTTEEIELNFFDSDFHWSNAGLLKCSGDLDLFIRNETKYDDCQLLHFPGMHFSIKFDWDCLGNPLDHHSVIPCAPDKVPALSTASDHDSYRAFRSQNLNPRISIESKMSNKRRPYIHMYSSTIRWMESIKWLFSGASRPIRRGPVFRKYTPRKLSFFRHLKKVQISLSLRELQVEYWTSASMKKGVLLNVAQMLSMSAEYDLKLTSINDGLKHRKRSEWSTIYSNCELSTADIWFQTSTENVEERFLEKSFFFSVENVKYSREIDTPNGSDDMVQVFPSHSLIVQGARGAWTEANRDMCFSLYENWMRAHILRQQISSEPLKGINHVPPRTTTTVATGAEATSGPPSVRSLIIKDEEDPSLSNLASWKTTTDVVEKLLSTAELGSSNHTPIVYSEDQSTDTKKKDMEAMMACNKRDVLHSKWNIKFLNSQMLLKGIETRGYVILSASKAEIVQNLHVPVWKDQTLLSKKSWSGSLESMQCFATVSANHEQKENDKLKADQISWLTRNIIEERNRTTGKDASALVGSGQSVGGVISKVVGADDEQLQRIVSRCKCEFFYVDYDDCEELLKRIPRPTTEDFRWTEDGSGSNGNTNNNGINNDCDIVNSFSLVHHDLNICTNSLQYSVVLDVLNNLLLYTEPATKSRTENYLSMKYRLMLSNIEDQWKPITQLQTEVRHLVCLIRKKEKAIYNIQNTARHSSISLSTASDLDKLEVEAQSLKDIINSKSQELEIRVRCLREFQLSSSQKQALNYDDIKQPIRRKNEIFFSRAQWRLTENDGQLGIADASISNFFYTKTLMRDDTTEHSLEMGYIYVKNLIPNQIYEEVLFPTELKKHAPLDRHPTLRVFCREKPPVGGISVKDHFEINLSPLTISITHAFYYKIMHFCFPEKQEYEEMVKKPARRKTGKTAASEKPKSNFYVNSPLSKDDVEMMKYRAQQNKLFVYIKIPEVPICVSYKGEKEKNQISDLTNFVLHVPNIEYHNVTWTWLDLLLSIKSQGKDSLISQLIKEKLKLRQRVVNITTNDDTQNDDEKAKRLLGIIPISSKSGFVKK